VGTWDLGKEKVENNENHDTCERVIVLDIRSRLTRMPRIQASSPRSIISKWLERVDLNLTMRGVEHAVIAKSSVDEQTMVVPSLSWT